MSSLDFLSKLQALSRDELLEIIKGQHPDMMQEIRRIEWVFENKLRHLNWPDGTPIEGRPFTNEELSLLIDEPFNPDNGLTRAGMTIDQQRQLHIARDPVMWARAFLRVDDKPVSPRVYQILILRHPSLRKVLRAGRRLGKTFSMSLILLHYSYTHNDGRCIVVAPMKAQAELIYQEMMRLTKNSVVKESISRAVTSPQFMIEMSNGSTIRFFTSGIRSGGKADVVRGQEAHIIVLDELDYMHGDDLESLYAMLQQTSEGQEDKILIGASTPTGRREHFWKWCTGGKFREFWFPSYANPFFKQKDEDEFHEQYSEMGYRHEVEADWGEDVDGVYPRKYVDLAFNNEGWEYLPDVRSTKSFFVMGVDWDKYGAGVNVAVLEVCQGDYEDVRFRNKIRLAYREEIKKDEYHYIKSVDRIIELNHIFKPKHIYVDKGSGEVQTEMLHKHGVEHPETKLRKTVRAVAFSETLEVRDPATKKFDKKPIKPFMVNNLRNMLEKEQIMFPSNDDVKHKEGKSLYIQLISYIVLRETEIGKPVFEASGTAEDHIHDALILACLAIAQNYDDLMKTNLAVRGRAVSNETFLPIFNLDNPEDVKIAESVWGPNLNEAPVEKKRSLTAPRSVKNPYRPLRRKSF